MRGVVLPLLLFVAVAATAGIGLYVLRGKAVDTPLEDADTGVDESTLLDPGAGDGRPGRIRPYQTTITLTEDLRDALAGPPEVLAREWRRVSQTLRGKASWMLENPAPVEASPRVRALLVLSVGVHKQDRLELHVFLRDSSPLVRRAVALAVGHQPGGSARATLLPGVEVPLGRSLPETTANRLRAQLEREEDEATRAALQKVLSSAVLSAKR